MKKKLIKSKKLNLTQEAQGIIKSSELQSQQNLVEPRKIIKTNKVFQMQNINNSPIKQTPTYGIINKEYLKQTLENEIEKDPLMQLYIEQKMKQYMKVKEQEKIETKPQEQEIKERMQQVLKLQKVFLQKNKEKPVWLTNTNVIHISLEEMATNMHKKEVEKRRKMIKNILESERNIITVDKTQIKYKKNNLIKQLKTIQQSIYQQGRRFKVEKLKKELFNQSLEENFQKEL